MKLPMGRFGSLSPARLLRMALAIAHDGLVLADDVLVQLVFHLQQTGRLVVFQPLERHAGHLADDFGNHFLIDNAVDFLGFLTPFPRDAFLLLLQLVGLIAKLGGLFEILLGNRGFLLVTQLLDLGVELFQIRRPGHRLQANAGAGFVENVDGLVRQVAAADVAIGKLDGRAQSLVLDLHAVMSFIAIAQTAENLDGLVAQKAD